MHTIELRTKCTFLARETLTAVGTIVGDALAALVVRSGSSGGSRVVAFDATVYWEGIALKIY